jgi:DNA-binding beta-propeller fold protein YncE
MLKQLLITASLTSIVFAGGASKVWESQKVMAVPESVILDNNTNLLYVANINGKPTAKDGNGFISILDTNGKVKNLKFATGLDAPKGMDIQNNRLYVSDISSLKVINLSNGKIEKDYKIDEALFLNDVVVSSDGTIYVSDFAGGNNAVYKIDEEVEKFLDSDALAGERPNGLWLEEGVLVVGTKSGSIYKYDMLTKKRTTFQKNIGVNGIDGILPYKNGYITSDWAGRVFLNDGKNSNKILDGSGDKVNAADIWYDEASNMLYIPTFFDNRILSYKVK